MQTKKIFLTGSAHGLLRREFLDGIKKSLVVKKNSGEEELRKKLLEEIRKNKEDATEPIPA